MVPFETSGILITSDATRRTPYLIVDVDDGLAGLYALEVEVGSGATGRVFRAHSVQNPRHSVAIKSMRKADMNELWLRRCKAECYRLYSLKHDNIVALEEVIEDRDHVHAVMQFIDGRDLESILTQGKPLRERDARALFWQLCSALAYLHESDIVHRDVKPKNIIIDAQSGRPFLCDFGLSTAVRPERGARQRAACGTLIYAAPEVFTSGVYLGPEIDVWSAGVTLYAMLTCTVPFWSATQDKSEIRGKIRKGVFEWPGKPCKASDAAKDLVARMLTVDPRRRASLAEVMSHRFFGKAILKQQLREQQQQQQLIADMQAREKKSKLLSLSAPTDKKKEKERDRVKGKKEKEREREEKKRKAKGMSSRALPIAESGSSASSSMSSEDEPAVDDYLLDDDIDYQGIDSDGAQVQEHSLDASTSVVVTLRDDASSAEPRFPSPHPSTSPSPSSPPLRASPSPNPSPNPNPNSSPNSSFSPSHASPSSSMRQASPPYPSQRPPPRSISHMHHPPSQARTSSNDSGLSSHSPSFSRSPHKDRLPTEKSAGAGGVGLGPGLALASPGMGRRIMSWDAAPAPRGRKGRGVASAGPKRGEWRSRMAGMVRKEPREWDEGEVALWKEYAARELGAPCAIVVEYKRKTFSTQNAGYRDLKERVTEAFGLKRFWLYVTGESTRQIVKSDQTLAEAVADKSRLSLIAIEKTNN